MIRCDKIQLAGKLQEISLAVSPGEVVGIVGSRGSGKTTLLRIMAGLIRPDSGQVTLGGTAGFAGEAWGLYERLTARENLLMFARLWGVADRRVDDLLAKLELTACAGTRAAGLSPGEAARLRLARALLQDPPALVLDEPFGDIDRESSSIIAFAIGEERDRDKAILIATFGLPRALELATRLCYLEAGRLHEPAPHPALTEPAPAKKAAPRTGHIAARKGDRIRLFLPDEILYAYAQDKSVFIHTDDGPCTATYTLSDLEDRLADHGFFRCHRGFLVNVRYVREIAAWTRDSFSLILKDGKEVPLSKHRAQDLKIRLSL